MDPRQPPPPRVKTSQCSKCTWSLLPHCKIAEKRERRVGVLIVIAHTCVHTLSHLRILTKVAKEHMCERHGWTMNRLLSMLQEHMRVVVVLIQKTGLMGRSVGHTPPTFTPVWCVEYKKLALYTPNQPVCFVCSMRCPLILALVGRGKWELSRVKSLD